MPDRSFTVEDVLRMMQLVKRDVEYLKELESKWEEQKERFPIIYDGIIKQREALRLKASKLRTLKVTVAAEEVENLATQLIESKTEEEVSSTPEKKIATAEGSKKSVAEFEPADVKPTKNVSDVGQRSASTKSVEERQKRRKPGMRTKHTK